MKRPILMLLFALVVSLQATAEQEPVFRFHLIGETYTLDPIKIRGSSGSYLFHNLYRGLYRYHRTRGLIPEGAKSCDWKNEKQLLCELAERKWSNGEPVRGQHYVKAFHRLVGPDSKSSNQEFLKELKNAGLIIRGQAEPKNLGIKVISAKNGREFLQFDFENPDPDFLYKLALPALTPIWQHQFPERSTATHLVVNGPYQIQSWTKGYGVRLIPNPHYPFKSKTPPPQVEALFVDDDTTALRLYEAGKLSFLRRLPSQYIGEFRKRKDFHQFPMARFDYMGFGPRLKALPELRKALALGANFEELKAIHFALGRPGCPALPANYLSTPIPCHEFLPKKGKAIVDTLKKQNKLPKNITFQYSKMGGEDIKRQAEWFQHQWKKNLGLTVNIEAVEQGMLTKKILNNPGDIFRKGQTLDRPTCLAAAESLVTGHPENYLQLNNSDYNGKVKSYVARVQEGQRKPEDCSELMKFVVRRHLFIPLGEIHFTMLATDQFSGWHINEINQMDLTELSVSD